MGVLNTSYDPQTEVVHLTEGIFVIPPSARVPDIAPQDIVNLLAGPSLRGRKAFGVMLALCAAGFVFSLFQGPHVQGALVSSLLGGICVFALYDLRKKPQLAARIAADPLQVSWAHPSIYCTGDDDLSKGINHATFHLKDGQTLSVAMSLDWMMALFIWLRQKNPAVRLTGSPPADAPR